MRGPGDEQDRAFRVGEDPRFVREDDDYGRMQDYKRTIWGWKDKDRDESCRHNYWGMLNDPS